MSDIFSRMDDPAAALAPPTQPAQPKQPADIFTAMGAATKIQATQNLVAAQESNPDQTARALQISRATGIPQPAAEQNLDEAQKAADLQKNVQVLNDSPNTEAFVAANPLAARLASDDFEKLGLLEKVSTALKTGVSSALMGNQLGRAGNVKQAGDALGIQTPQTDQEIQTLQSKLQAQPKLSGGFGQVQNFTGFITGLVDNAISALPEAAAGGVAGLFAGGVGAVPGAIAGEGIGFKVDAARVASGQAYIKLSQMRGSDGQPISEAGKQFGAIFTGAATYALFSYAGKIESKLLGETAESLVQQAVNKAVQTPTFANAAARFAGGVGKGAAQGAGVMTAMEASGIIGEEIAKAVSAGHFDTNPAEIVERLSDAAINGALLLGTLHGAMGGLGLYGDFRNAARAEQQTAMFKNLLDGATDAKLRERDLQAFQEFMQHQTDGSPVENIYIPAERVRELYQGIRMEPAMLTDRTQDPLFGFVADMPKQLEEAAATGGDIVIPTADFVARLAGTPVAEHLLPDIRVGADAMSLNEAKQFTEEYQRRAKVAVDEAAKGDQQSATQRIADEVRQQMIAAGRSESEARAAGAVFAARYEARAERRGRGESPLELYQAEGPKIIKGSRDQAQEVGKRLGQDAPAGWGSVDGGDSAPREARGSITFGAEHPVIKLFQNAQPSTIIHEGGHNWLEELAADASAKDAPTQLREDMQAVLDWFGVKGDKDQTALQKWQSMHIFEQREHHEQFARGVERYLMEGKAPGTVLARVFSRFKAWLTKIYRAVDELNSPINDDIRAVFDRLLATDAEIADARKTVGLEPSFKDRAEAGMTQAEWGAYLRAIDKANTQAESTLLDKMMGRVRRQRSAEFREERNRVADQVAAEVDAQPDMQALNLLRHGKMPDGTEQKVKLNSDDLRTTYGAEFVKELPAGIASKEGVHPDYVAEMLGYDSGDALVQSMKTLEGQQREIRKTEGERRTLRQYQIDTETERRMSSRKGEVEDEAGIKDEAIAAVHGEGRAELLAVELRYLRRMGARELEAQGAKRNATGTPEPKEGSAATKSAQWNEQVEKDMAAAMRESVTVTKPMLEAIRAHADAALARKTTAEVGRYQTFLRDERKAAREVEQAILKKDWAAAAAAKQRQIVAHVLYTKAKAASAEVERGEATFKRLTSKPSFKGIDQAYTDQMQDLLARFGFDSGRGEELQRGKTQTLEEFVKDKADESGIEIAVDPALYTLQGKPLAELTMGEFRALHEAVDSMNALGRGEKLIEVDGVKRDFDEVRDEMVAAIRALGERLKSDFYDPRDAGKLAAAQEKLFGAMRGIDASLTKPEALFDQIDRGDSFGIMNRAVFRRLKEAQGREDRWHEEAAGEMKAAVDAAGKEWRKRLDAVVPDDPALLNPETGRPMKLTRKRMLSMALNWGNEGNRTKLADGYKWTQPAIKAFLDRNMSKADWDFVQRVWGMFDAHKEDLDALQRRVTGVGLEMVKADPVSTPHGTYAGGYYPIVYDAAKSFNAEAHAEKGTEALFPSNYTRATTPKGSTISRVEGVKRPIQLSLDVAPWKIGQTLHDLAFREAIIDADRLLSNDGVKKAMDDVFGSEYRKLLRPWLKHIANSKNIDDAAISWIDKAIATARTNVVIVGIGFRLSTMFKHGFSALSNSFKEVGPEWMLKGTREFYAPGRMKENWEFITSKSDEMRYRLNAYDKDITSNYNVLLKESSYSAFQRQAQHFGHLGVSYLDLGSAAPTWLGAYRKALHEGMADKDAVYQADKTVRNAHGAQGITDTAAIQRANGTAKLVNMFYGFFNHIYNRQRTMFIQGAEGVRNLKAGDTKAATRNFADVLATSFWYLAVPALIETLATHGGPNEDKDEGWGAWAGKAILSEIPAGIPILRDIAKAAIEGRDYEISPIAKAVNDAIQAGHDISKVAQGEDAPPNMTKHLVTAAGYGLGLPTSAPFTAGKFLWDINNGDADPENVKDWYQGITTGKVHHK